MKKLIRIFYLPLLITLLFSCNNNNDAVKEAKKENKEMIDSQIDKHGGDSSAINMQPTKEDANFLVDAASGGMLEVQLGELAQTHAKSKRVKAFGEMMMRDHTLMGAELKTLALSKNITLPDSVSNKQQGEKDRLAKEKGDVFDRDYMDLMVSDHKEDIDEFEKCATKGTNPEIKTFANDNLRTLHIHLDSAISIQKLVGPKEPTSDETISFPK